TAFWRAFWELTVVHAPTAIFAMWIPGPLSAERADTLVLEAASPRTNARTLIPARPVVPSAAPSSYEDGERWQASAKPSPSVALDLVDAGSATSARRCSRGSLRFCRYARTYACLVSAAPPRESSFLQRSGKIFRRKE